jgi:hypothetical protein
MFIVKVFLRITGYMALLLIAIKGSTILGMNLQWPNTCPGHTDRLASDFLVG